MSGRAERVGKNEALFREVNERIRDITTYHGDAEFLCECGDPSCAQPILIRLDEYEETRKDPTQFFVVPGHEMTDVELVVLETERYSIVRKRPGTPSEVAIETDPRG